MEERERLSDRFKRSFVFRSLWLISTAIAATVRLKVVDWDILEKAMAAGKGGLVLLWHGATILPIYRCRHMGFYSIVSVSKDGELQNMLLRSRGYKTIRGSSGRHGMRALLEAIRLLQGGNMIAITPDGPKGPLKKVQPGTVHLAQRSGCPVIPVGIACEPCKRLKSWDSHMIPLPFAKAVMVFGEPLWISNTEDESDAAVRIEQAINDADCRAGELLSGACGGAK